MPAEKVASRCPVCQDMSLVDHCPSGKCRWHSCRNKACEAVLDLGRRRGHCLSGDGDGKRRNVVLGSAA